MTIAKRRDSPAHVSFVIVYNIIKGICINGNFEWNFNTFIRPFLGAVATVQRSNQPSYRETVVEL